MKEAATRSQILITTHSPDLLDTLDEDEVRVVGKVDGVTTMEALRSEQKETVRTRLMPLGEIARAEGLLPEPS